MKRLFSTFALIVCAAAAVAGQVCTLDPPRPGTGTGFYVSGAKLYDPTGTEFRIRGTNQSHCDSPGAATGIPLSGANTVRMAICGSRSVDYNLSALKAHQAAGLVPMPGRWNGTCSSNVALLTTMVDAWVAEAPTWTKLNATGLINIANEWGPPNSVVWRDNYITAIARMRAAGYTGTLVVDSGGCGQDPLDIVAYGPAVLASDPQKNILFDVHVYGAFHLPAAASWQTDYAKSMAALKASGLPIILGEFGPGANIGPSPTTITPQQVVATAEDAGFGWLSWAWDDNNLAGCQGNDYWFSMTVNCGKYTGLDTELTTFGRAVVPMMKSGAKRAAFK
jgi:mannan endo-1,4-beta-mannosidase